MWMTGQGLGVLQLMMLLEADSPGFRGLVSIAREDNILRINHEQKGRGEGRLNRMESNDRAGREEHTAVGAVKATVVRRARTARYNDEACIVLMIYSVIFKRC